MSQRPSLVDLEVKIHELEGSLGPGVYSIDVRKKLLAVNIEIGKLREVSRNIPTMQTDLVELETAINVITTGVHASDWPKAARGLQEAQQVFASMKGRTLPQKNL